VKAAVLHELGKPPKFEECEEPEAGEGEVLVRVRAAALKPVDRQLTSGTHFASPKELPVVCGTDGVGKLADGTRVFFGGCRFPFGAMAERTVVPRACCFPLPRGIEDHTAAALGNPGVSAWISLTQRAKLERGETALILGATGVTGQLAVQIAKLLGAKRVIGVGRNERVLGTLGELGADATIQLDQAPDTLQEAYLSEMGFAGFDVILDYLWGEPTEALLSAMTKAEFAGAERETRLLQCGESAGSSIKLPAAVLRSTRTTMLGTGGIPSPEILHTAMNTVMAAGARGELRIDTQQVALAEIERVWKRRERSGRRVVVVP
jgi:NADPH:quinone reductase-like Zn-dependent oxidoreductase